MKTSVILSTYNGEKYIQEQLLSLLHQTIKPDEVIISDDNSSDSTRSIIKNFIAQNNLSNWVLFENSENLGWQKNFMESFKKATGDLIFPCDQDDVWHPDKIEKMVSKMVENKNILVLASNYTPFYQDSGFIISKRITKSMRFDGKINKYPFNELLMYIVRPGCVYCFRRSLLPIVNNFWFEGYPHDALLWRISNLLDGLYIYNYSTIEFRRHSSNASNAEVIDRNTRKEMINFSLKALNQLYDICSRFSEIKNKEEKRNFIINNIAFCKLRLALLEKRNLLYWFKLVLNYRNYYLTGKSLVGDFVVGILRK